MSRVSRELLPSTSEESPASLDLLDHASRTALIPCGTGLTLLTPNLAAIWKRADAERRDQLLTDVS